MKKTILFFLVSIMSGSILIGQNLLTNPGFEDWTVNGAGGPPDGWSLSSGSMTGSQEATIFHNGSYSTNVTWTTTSTVYLQQVDIPITAGNNYSFSYWVYDNDPGGRARVYIRWWNSTGGGVYPSGEGGYSTDLAEWQLLSLASVQAPANAVTASVEIRVYDISGWPGTATVYVDDASMTDVSSLPATIINAYATSSTSVDLVFDKNMTTVDVSDYYITGTSYVSFSTAVIDGIDATIVHLTGGSPSMIGDITLDEIFDDGNETSYEFYAGIMPISNTNTNNPGGIMDNIHTATFHGIVSANDLYNNVWVSDAAGQYNGALIFDYDFDSSVSTGDEIIFSASRTTYNNLTELTDPLLISTLSSGNTPYGPTSIDGSDIDETIPADTDPAEPWEGQLVRITDFTVESFDAVNYKYRCSWTDGGPTYYFHIGDNVDYHFGSILLSIGSTYDAITGVVDWDGTNYRINPRNQGDITGGLPALALAIVSVNGGLNPYVNADFEVIVQAQDKDGYPAAVSGNVNFNFTTNNPGSVDFTLSSTTTGTIIDGTSQITVTGVQMEPAGTNVTITVNDDNTFNGLISGTSASFDVIELIIPDLVISEVMQNPDSVGDTAGEWFEVYNNSATPIDMTGWVMEDLGTNTHTIAGPLSVPAYGFAVLGNNDDILTNGGYTCNYEYSSTFSLANGDDEIILYLPDGVTEIDRVEWDGGPIWPDPTGTSMTFHGFPTDDNNDGTNWTYATFREASYVGTEGDRGTPGSNGYDQILTGGFKLDLKVLLQGPYNMLNDSMSNDLRANGYIPSVQPFNPTLPYYGNNTPVWLYGGTETTTYFPFYGTDWILVEIRDAASAGAAGGGTMIAQYPAYLMVDGQVVSLNGTTPLNVNLAYSNSLFVVIWHRNHLGIMTASGLNPADGTIESYDYTTGSGQVHNGAAGYTELEAGIWGMVIGDVDADGSIDASDNADGWSSDVGNAGYLGGDLDLNGQSQNQDKNDVWLQNNGTNSQVPN